CDGAAEQSALIILSEQSCAEQSLEQSRAEQQAGLQQGRVRIDGEAGKCVVFLETLQVGAGLAGARCGVSPIPRHTALDLFEAEARLQHRPRKILRARRQSS